MDSYSKGGFIVKAICFWIVYLPLLGIWSVFFGIYVGVLGAVIGVIQRYIDCVRVENVGIKRYPLRALKQYVSAHQRSVDRHLGQHNDYSLQTIQSKIQEGSYKRPSIVFSALIYLLYFLLFSPFFIMYGMLFKGPLSTFKDGIVYWRRVVLRQSIYDIYA